jgi:hypothetical protein
LFVLNEIPEVLATVVDQQRLGRRPFREDDFVGFQFDVEILDGLTIIHVGQRDCLPIHKPLNGDKKAIDEEAVVRRKEQVATGVLIGQGKSRDPDRRDTPMPGGAGLLVLLASDPFDRHRPPKRIHERADRQLFNGNFAIGRLNQRSLKETPAGSATVTTAVVVPWGVIVVPAPPNPTRLPSSTSKRAGAS